MKYRLRYLLTVLLLLFSCGTKASDSLQISVLTCAPGQEVYDLYGHTALRVKNATTGDDRVYNFGIFNFKAPNFMGRFIAGKPDYKMGVAPYDAFAWTYAMHDRWMDEQVLDLTPGEAEKLVAELAKIEAVEDWTYRYNILYDNCTTRALRMVENALAGRVEWPADSTRHTFREILHEFNGVEPWSQYGADLLLGTEVDKPLDVHRQLFAPLYAERYLENAYVRAADGTRRKLVATTRRVVDVQAPEPTPASFGIVNWALLLAAAALLLVEYRLRRRWWPIDAALLTVQGLLGCIVAYLFFFSEHPGVDSNWNLLWLNPLPLLFVYGVVRAERARRLHPFYYGELFVLLAVGVLALLHVQEIPVASALWGVLLLRAVGAFLTYKRKQR